MRDTWRSRAEAWLKIKRSSSPGVPTSDETPERTWTSERSSTERPVGSKRIEDEALPGVPNVMFASRTSWGPVSFTVTKDPSRRSKLMPSMPMFPTVGPRSALGSAELSTDPPAE